jgi:hypothetical protein
VVGRRANAPDRGKSGSEPDMRIHSIPPLSPKDVSRFWSKVVIDTAQTCWLWQAARSKDGYGVMRVGDTFCYAHRIVYTLFHGQIPADMVIDHTCRTPHCVNPNHLEVVTNEENVRRGSTRMTTCRKGHPRDEVHSYTVELKRNGRSYTRRLCRPCQREYNRRYKLKKAAA